ncbi:glycosyltransferase family 2 protein [Paenibacillus oryzisoli]|uniref:glycosyltransferase family 2 protein n=1 Tax=Paenibacillus oryzisoli TaxID=1850517 RepID=UPI003D2A2462
MEKITVDILLSTYNGEVYLLELLESLSSQTFSDWRLIVRDDGSNDHTLRILKQFEETSGHSVRIIDSAMNIGPCRSFLELLSYSDASYVMFCDQDDVWLPNKIQCLLGIVTKWEENHSKDVPVLVHSDLSVVDSSLRIISPSFWRYQKINSKRNQLHQLLVQNNVTGCSLLMNRKLADLTQTAEEGIIMHDWWVGIIASAFGVILYTDDKTVMYRQHDNNDTGAHLFFSFHYVLQNMIGLNFILSAIRTIEQANVFVRLYSIHLKKQQLEVVEDYALLLKQNLLKRVLSCLKHRFCKDSFIRNIGFIIAILIMREERT